MSSETSSRHLAAIDLGSNSFHMIVASEENGQLLILDKLKEMVRLAEGLNEKKQISSEVMERGISCLSRFGERLRGFPADSVRVVGTNTLRMARNGRKFLERAEEAVGFPIDIIAGREEARLIYLGVSHSLEDNAERRLVMDIGGGSTEYILGQQFKPEVMESLFMGCVSMSKRFFPKGEVEEASMLRAEIAALQELTAIIVPYKRMGWDTAIGASGTILAIRDVVVSQGWSQDGITAAALKKLRKHLLKSGHYEKFQLEGLSEERLPVFAGGVAILLATFQALDIEQMRVSSGALREGLIYEMLGRIHNEDVRERTVENLQSRYGVDMEHAQCVGTTAMQLLDQVRKDWKLTDDHHRLLLSWATRLHEMGLTVSHNQYHKHGAYVMSHLDLQGFSRNEQQILAYLIRGHRRKFSLSDKHLPKKTITIAARLCVLLRLAVVLNRSRLDTTEHVPELSVDGKNISIRFPEGWLESNPLTRADLEQEVAYLEAAEFKLALS